MSVGNKKAPKPAMNYLTVEGIRLLLKQPDTAKVLSDPKRKMQ